MESVPVPVPSRFSTPRSRTVVIRSRYWRTLDRVLCESARHLKPIRDRRATGIAMSGSEPAGRAIREHRIYRLLFLSGTAYIGTVRVRPDYGDKRLRNKRTGPGGGTRRLPQGASCRASRRGRNRIDGRVKAVLSLGMVPPLSG